MKKSRQYLPFSNLNLILACLSDNIAVEDLLRNNSQKIDWQDFLKRVYWHRVAPAIYERVKTFPSSLFPAQVLAQLKAHVSANNHKILRMSAGLVQLNKMFEQANIANLCIKGPPLALQIYGDICARECRDIDILISSTQVQKAHEVLQAHGYKKYYSSRELSDKQLKYWLKSNKDISYRNLENNVHLELHWRLCDMVTKCERSLEELLSESRAVWIGGASISTMSFSQNFIYLAAHASGHSWSNLYWLYDIAQIIKSNKNMDWSEVFAHAQEQKVHLQVFEAFLLAQELLNTSLPDDVSERLKQHKNLGRLTYLSTKVMSQEKYKSPMIYALKIRRLFYLQVFASGIWARMTVFLSKAMLNSWETLSLPDKYFILYYPLRPLLWLWRCVAKCEDKKSLSSAN